MVTIIVYLYKACIEMTFFRGYLLDSACTVYMFLSHDCHHVPVKLRGASGPFHTFVLTGQLSARGLDGYMGYQHKFMSIKSMSLLKPGATRCHGTRIARGVPLPVYNNLDLYSGFWCTSHCVVFKT